MNEVEENVISSYEKLVSMPSPTHYVKDFEPDRTESERHKKLKGCAAKILEKLGCHQIDYERRFNLGIIDCLGQFKGFTIAIECGGLDIAKFTAMVNFFDFVIHIPYRKEVNRFLFGCILSYKNEGKIITVGLEEDYYFQITNIMEIFSKQNNPKSVVFRKELQRKTKKLKQRAEDIKQQQEKFLEQNKDFVKLREKMYEIYGPDALNQTRPLIEKLDIKLKYALFLVSEIQCLVEKHDVITTLASKAMKQIDSWVFRKDLRSLQEAMRALYNTLFYALESPTSLPYFRSYSGRINGVSFDDWCQKLDSNSELHHLVKNCEGYWRRER